MVGEDGWREWIARAIPAVFEDQREPRITTVSPGVSGDSG